MIVIFPLIGSAFWVATVTWSNDQKTITWSSHCLSVYWRTSRFRFFFFSLFSLFDSHLDCLFMWRGASGTKTESWSIKFQKSKAHHQCKAVATQCSGFSHRPTLPNQGFLGLLVIHLLLCSVLLSSWHLLMTCWSNPQFVPLYEFRTILLFVRWKVECERCSIAIWSSKQCHFESFSFNLPTFFFWCSISSGPTCPCLVPQGRTQ